MENAAMNIFLLLVGIFLLIAAKCFGYVYLRGGMQSPGVATGTLLLAFLAALALYAGVKA